MSRPPVLYMAMYDGAYVDASLVRDLCAARGKAATTLRKQLQALMSDPKWMPDGRVPEQALTVEEKRYKKA